MVPAPRGDTVGGAPEAVGEATTLELGDSGSNAAHVYTMQSEQQPLGIHRGDDVDDNDDVTWDREGIHIQQQVGTVLVTTEKMTERSIIKRHP